MTTTTAQTTANETQPAPEILAERASSAAWHAAGLASEAAEYTDDAGAVLSFCSREHARAARCYRQYSSAAITYREQLAAAIGEEAAQAMLRSVGAPANFVWTQPAAVN